MIDSMPVRMSIAGSRALVTGASGGLGDAIARRLATEGAGVVVTGRRRDVLAKLADDIGGACIVSDLDQPQLDELTAAAERSDIVVLNAALPATGPLDDFTLAEVDRALSVNLRAPIVLARAASIGMIARRRGHLVFVSSLAAKTNGQALSLYAGTKLGLRGVALALRQDLRASGVGVSIVYPGPIRDAGMWADTKLETPFGVRTRSPAEVADAVIRAVTRNRAEIDVAPPLLRIGARFALTRPALFAAFGRLAGADRYATAMTEAARAKR